MDSISAYIFVCFFMKLPHLEIGEDDKPHELLRITILVMSFFPFTTKYPAKLQHLPPIFNVEFVGISDGICRKYRGTF